MITKLHELNPTINAPTISNILFMEDIKQEQFWDFVKEVIKEKVLAPLTIIYTYRRYKIFNKLFRDNEEFEYLTRIFVATAPLNEKYLVIIGISTYAYKRIKELVEHDKRNAVELIMENISEDFDAYLFTGTTYLDIEGEEHYSFISLGKVHIVDDSLAKYAETIKLNLNDSFCRMMKKQIILAFEDNLRILDRN